MLSLSFSLGTETYPGPLGCQSVSMSMISGRHCHLASWTFSVVGPFSSFLPSYQHIQSDESSLGVERSSVLVKPPNANLLRIRPLCHGDHPKNCFVTKAVKLFLKLLRQRLPAVCFGDTRRLSLHCNQFLLSVFSVTPLLRPPLLAASGICTM
jgi:hypothetical protein